MLETASGAVRVGYHLFHRQQVAAVGFAQQPDMFARCFEFCFSFFDGSVVLIVPKLGPRSPLHVGSTNGVVQFQRTCLPKQFAIDTQGFGAQHRVGEQPDVFSMIGEQAGELTAVQWLGQAQVR